MLTSIKEYRKYKQALKVLPHLEVILKIVRLTEAGLGHFNNYIPVARILLVIKQEKSILESYQQEYTKAKENKGRIDEKT